MKKVEVDINRVKELAANHTGVEIAEIMGISKYIIYARLKELGIPAGGNDRFENLNNINTEDYTLEELASIFSTSKTAIYNKLRKENLPYKGRKSESKSMYKNNNGYDPARNEMERIKEKSKLVSKEAEARKQGMHYADVQKAETLKMFGKVEL